MANLLRGAKSESFGAFVRVCQYRNEEGWGRQPQRLHSRVRRRQCAHQLPKLPKSRSVIARFCPFVFFGLFTRSSVISVNLHNFHVLPSIKPEDAPVAREMAEDLRLCIAGARVSDHSKDMLPAYDTVRLKILDMLQIVEAAAAVAE